jgi:hypothetical protein
LAEAEVTVLVSADLEGGSVWQGEVEVFDLRGHPNATRCYAWGYLRYEPNNGLEVVVVLEIPPVRSPRTAIRFAYAGLGKR